MKPVAAGARRVANFHTSPFAPFVFPDGVALGDEVLQVDDTNPLGVGFHVYRMAPGMTTRPHRHNGSEHFVVLEGELIESDGTVFRKGDIVCYHDGTEHNSYSPNGCTLVVYITRPEVLIDG